MDKQVVRLKQRSFLKAAFGTADEGSSKHILPPSLFLWGPSSTGKTFVLEQCLKESGIQAQISINSLEAMCGWKALVHSILRQLQEIAKTKQPTGGRGRTDRWENEGDNSLDSFIYHVQSLLVDEEEQHPVILVVDNAELLKEFDDDMLHTLLYLNEFTGRNFCVVLLSKVPWKLYSHLQECPPPIQLHFPQYTEEETMRIILGAPPPGVNTPVFEFYVKMVVKVYYPDCRDLRKLWNLVRMRQEEFQGPFDDVTHDIKQSNLNDMWVNIRSILRNDFRSHNSRGKGEHKWGRRSRFGDVPELKLPTGDMPVSCVYLLIAAFIASTNHHSADRKLFVKAKLSCGRKKGPSSKQHKGGIPHSRLLAIFCQISGPEFPLDTSILSSLEALCRLDFMSRTDGEDGMDEPKYRLHLPPETIQKLCSEVKLELNKLIGQ